MLKLKTNFEFPCSVHERRLVFGSSPEGQVAPTPSDEQKSVGSETLARDPSIVLAEMLEKKDFEKTPGEKMMSKAILKENSNLLKMLEQAGGKGQFEGSSVIAPIETNSAKKITLLIAGLDKILEKQEFKKVRGNLAFEFKKGDLIFEKANITLGNNQDLMNLENNYNGNEWQLEGISITAKVKDHLGEEYDQKIIVSVQMTNEGYKVKMRLAPSEMIKGIDIAPCQPGGCAKIKSLTKEKSEQLAKAKEEKKILETIPDAQEREPDVPEIISVKVPRNFMRGGMLTMNITYKGGYASCTSIVDLKNIHPSPEFHNKIKNLYPKEYNQLPQTA